jgi:hypothetical protein
MRSDRSLKRWYNRINRRFFDGELPYNVCVRWVDPDEEEEIEWEEKYFGWAGKADADNTRHSYVIILARDCQESSILKLATLAHEMVHVGTGCKDDHGPAFDDWHKRLTYNGLFKKHAVLKGATLF